MISVDCPHFFTLVASVRADQFVIPILVIRKERPKNSFYPWGKNIIVCLACNTLPCTPVCTEKSKNNARDDVEDAYLPHYPQHPD